MNEKPILFNAEMVRAVLDGRKTQTRRVIDWKRLHKQAGLPFPTKCKLAWYMIIDSWGLGDGFHIGEVKCPYGKKGDRLYVKEEYRGYEGSEEFMMLQYRADREIRETPKHMDEKQCLQFPDTHIELAGAACVSDWKRARFMPRWASRINLEIVDIRVERVASISPSDCSKEGVTFRKPEGCWTNTQYNENAVIDFKTLWDSINANRKDKDGNLLNYSWADNPFCWVVEFKRIK